MLNEPQFDLALGRSILRLLTGVTLIDVRQFHAVVGQCLDLLGQLADLLSLLRLADVVINRSRFRNVSTAV